MSIHPEDMRATETARRLVTCYLDPELNVHEAIREVVATESTTRLCRVIYMLAGALGDTYDDLEDYSRHVLEALGDAE